MKFRIGRQTKISDPIRIRNFKKLMIRSEKKSDQLYRTLTQQASTKTWVLGFELDIVKRSCSINWVGSNHFFVTFWMIAPTV